MEVNHGAKEKVARVVKHAGLILGARFAARGRVKRRFLDCSVE